MKITCPNDQIFEIEDKIISMVNEVNINNDQNSYNCDIGELTLELSAIETPFRDIWFRDEETISNILSGFVNNTSIPPIEVTTRDLAGTHNYKVTNGFHRYWLSHLVGFSKIPANVNNFKMSDLDDDL